MPYINLIQEQRTEAKRNENRARLFFLTFVGSAALSVLVLGGLMIASEEQKAQESDLNTRAQKLAPLVKRIQSNENDYAELAPRLTTLENAQLITGRWTRILDHLSRQTPEQTWLTSIRCTASDPTKPIEVTFVGVSTQQQMVGDFMERLQGCPDLTNVTLKYTMEKLISNISDIEFQVTADINGTAEKQKDEMKKEEDQ